MRGIKIVEVHVRETWDGTMNQSSYEAVSFGGWTHPVQQKDGLLIVFDGPFDRESWLKANRLIGAQS